MKRPSDQVSVVSDQLDADKVAWIKIAELAVSPNETRKTIDRNALDSLAKTIAEGGVREPLIVRWLPSPGLYEIVAGQRRYLASKIAGKTGCPCIVRDMSDAEADEWRTLSNLQREDLPPLEQALAFHALLDAPGATIETVAAKLAMSPTFVGRRLKLLDAIEPVREALRVGAIEVGHALELARLSERQQEELLEYLGVGYRAPEDDDEEGSGRDDDDDVDEPGTCIGCGKDEAELGGRGWANTERTVCNDEDCVAEAHLDGKLKGFTPTRTTVASLRSRIAHSELKVLRDVPFPLDAELPPVACTACPKRAAGPTSLFADFADDICTDPDCLATKLRVWVKAQLQKADEEKRELVMLSDGYTSEKSAVSRYNVVVGVGCAAAEVAIWVSGARIGHIVQICRDSKCPEHGAGAEADAAASGNKGGVVKAAAPKQTAEEKRKGEAQKQERAKLAEKVRKEREYRGRLFAAIAAVPDAQIDAPRIQLLTRQVCFRVLSESQSYAEELGPALGWPANVFEYSGNDEKLAALMQGLTPQAALRAAALCLIVDQVTVGDYEVSQGRQADRMERIASYLGLDVKAIRSGKPAPVEKVVAPAKKEKPAPAPKLSGEARKRIAEAQKKRWTGLKQKPAKPAARKATAKPSQTKAAKKAVKR